MGIPAARVALGLQRTEAWAIAGAAPGLAAARDRIGLAPDPRGDALRRAPALTATPAALEAPFTAGGRVHRFRAAEAAAAAPTRGPATGGRSSTSPSARSPALTYFPGFYRDAIAALAPCRSGSW